MSFVHLLERDMFQTEWNSISLVDIARQRNLPPREVAAADFYSEFYRRLEESGYRLDPRWIEEKKGLGRIMQRYYDRENVANEPALSIAQGWALWKKT